MAIYVLIDSNNDIVDKIDSVTAGGAEYYFMKRKQMKDEKSLYKVWKIKTKKENDLKELQINDSIIYFNISKSS